MSAARPLRFVLQGIAEGLIVSLLLCVLGALASQLAG